MKRVSFYFTNFYKCFAYFKSIIFLLMTIFFIYRQDYFSVFITSGASLIIFALGKLLKNIFVQDSVLIYKGLFKKKKIDISKIKNITCFFYFCYVSLDNGIKFFFIPNNDYDLKNIVEQTL